MQNMQQNPPLHCCKDLALLFAYCLAKTCILMHIYVKQWAKYSN